MKLKIIAFLILLFAVRAVDAQSGNATISGTLAGLKDSDQVILRTYWYGNPDFSDGRSVVCLVKQHSFSFNIPVASSLPMHLSLVFKEKDNDLAQFNAYHRFNLSNYYVEAGDRIHMSEGGQGILFEGAGKEKYNLVRQLNTTGMAYSKKLDYKKPDIHRQAFALADELLLKKMRMLDSSKTMLSSRTFDLIKSDIIGGWYYRSRRFYPMGDSTRSAAIKSLGNYQKAMPAVLKANNHFSDPSILALGDLYSNGLIEKYKFDSCYVSGRPFKTEKCYAYIVNNFSGPLRERMITSLLFDRKVYTEDNSACVRNAFKYLKNPDFIKVIEQLKNNRIVGAKAYDFRLTDAKGKTHTMKEYKNKVVFIDFWFTGCGNCLQVAPYLAQLEKKYKHKPVVFLSINFDKSRGAWLKGIASGQYSSGDAVNLFAGTLKGKSSIIDFYNVDAGPTLIMVDQQGKLMINPIDPREDDGKSITEQIDKAIM